MCYCSKGFDRTFQRLAKLPVSRLLNTAVFLTHFLALQSIVLPRSQAYFRRSTKNRFLEETQNWRLSEDVEYALHIRLSKINHSPAPPYRHTAYMLNFAFICKRLHYLTRSTPNIRRLQSLKQLEADPCCYCQKRFLVGISAFLQTPCFETPLTNAVF